MHENIIIILLFSSVVFSFLFSYDDRVSPDAFYFEYSWLPESFLDEVFTCTRFR